MKVTNAIAHVLKKEGVEGLIGYPVNPIIEGAAEADIRTIMVRQERIGLHMCDAIGKRDLGREDRRLRDAARSRHRERLRRRRAILRQFVSGGGLAGRLCPQHQPGAPELQRRPEFPPRHQIVRAGDGRGRDDRDAAPRLHHRQERPARPGAGRVPDRHPARGRAGRAGRRIQEGAAPEERPRPEIGVADRRGAGRRKAAGHRRGAGGALRQGLAATEGAGRIAGSAGDDDPAGQERLPGEPSAVIGLGRHRHRRASVAHAAELRLHLRYRLQLHPHQLRHGDAEGQEDRPRDARSVRDQQGRAGRSGGGRRCRADARRAAGRSEGPAKGQDARPARLGDARDPQPPRGVARQNGRTG